MMSRLAFQVRRSAKTESMRLAKEPHNTRLPVRSMVGQLPLEQHIGVRIPDRQPDRNQQFAFQGRESSRSYFFARRCAWLTCPVRIGPRVPVLVIFPGAAARMPPTKSAPGRGNPRSAACVPGNIPGRSACPCLRTRWSHRCSGQCSR